MNVLLVNDGYYRLILARANHQDILWQVFRVKPRAMLEAGLTPAQPTKYYKRVT